MGDVLRHPLTVGIAAPLVVLFALSAIRLLRRIASTATAMDVHVLPHFVPAPDRVTLPAALDALRHDLTSHMHHEESLRAVEIERRDSWRHEIDHRFDKLEEHLK